MVTDPSGGGRFTVVTLHPLVTIQGEDVPRADGGVRSAPSSAEPGLVARAQALHTEAAAKCFIAASVNFPVLHEPVTVLSNGRTAS